ncbi:MAG: hypothetical protein CM15mP109_09140 [Candidatus Dadabacteria bacterium]|nr:MAG: hypothetical protein CM15mP109_09140 [Candidatus Dadabacteria bacterium]
MFPPIWDGKAPGDFAHIAVYPDVGQLKYITRSVRWRINLIEIIMRILLVVWAMGFDRKRFFIPKN